MSTPRSSLLAVALAASLTLLGACGTETENTASPEPAGAGTTATSAESPLVLEDGWAKATDGKMTGVFGTLSNDGDADIQLVGAESPLAGMGELHVTVDDGAGGRIMQKAEDGFVVPAGEDYELVPGGDHVMLMQLTAPVTNGQQVDLTLVDDAGTRYDVSVTARAFAGAEEEYAPGDGTSLTGLHGDGADATETP